MKIALICALLTVSNGALAQQNSDIERRQRQGIELVDEWLPPKAITALQRIMEEAFSNRIGFPGFSRLAARLSPNSLNAEMGYYLPQTATIIIDVREHFSELDYIQTLSHEMGHALLLSRAQPNTLARWSCEFGPWQCTKAPLFELNSPFFFLPHPDRDVIQDAWKAKAFVPSTYSLANRHEWFAEAFSCWIQNKMGIFSKLVPERFAHEVTATLEQ